MSELASGELLPPIYPLSEDGQMVVVTANKSGAVEGIQEAKQGKAFMPAVCGSVVAGELAAAFTMPEAAQQLRWDNLRINQPWEVLGWSLAAHDAVEPIHAILGPEEERQTSFEVRMYPPESAAEAALKVGALLEMEQDLPAEDRLVADMLRRNLLIGNPGELDSVPADYMKRLLRAAKPENGLEDLVYTMRTHHLAGDLVMAQKARADFINLKFEEGDTPEHNSTRSIAEAFNTVLNSSKSCDPDELNLMSLPYVDGNGERHFLRGPEIVHKAAELILSGKLRMQIGEIKALTMIGDQYEGFPKLYREYGYNLQNMYDGGMSSPLESKQRRNLLYRFEYDLAKTSLAVWNLFRIAENEYHTQPHTFRDVQNDLFLDDVDTRRPDELPASFIDPTLVLRKVDKVMVPIKFDIRANGRAVPTSANDPKPDYAPVPSLERLGVPKDVDVAHRYVDSGRVEQWWKLWAWELAEPEAAKDTQALTSKVVAAVRRSKGLATVG